MMFWIGKEILKIMGRRSSIKDNAGSNKSVATRKAPVQRVRGEFWRTKRR